MWCGRGPTDQGAVTGLVDDLGDTGRDCRAWSDHRGRQMCSEHGTADELALPGLK